MQKGRYRIDIQQPCKRFELYRSSGNTYHVRTIPEGRKSIFVNILHNDKYSANVPYLSTRVGDIEKGKDIDIADVERMRLKPVRVVYNEDLYGTPARIFSMNTPAVIEYGSKFLTLPEQQRMFILLHEYGHLFYATEWKVDKFALSIFLALGYNPSQAFHALYDVLGRSPQGIDRIKRLFNTLKENNYVNS